MKDLVIHFCSGMVLAGPEVAVPLMGQYLNQCDSPRLLTSDTICISSRSTNQRISVLHIVTMPLHKTEYEVSDVYSSFLLVAT